MSSLTYPFEAPEAGSFTTVAPGVHWIRLKLPFHLNHINVWALEDGDGKHVAKAATIDRF